MFAELPNTTHGKKSFSTIFSLLLPKRQLNNYFNNSIDQIPSCEANSSLAGQEIPGSL
jgi:hypothetical protein